MLIHLDYQYLNDEQFITADRAGQFTIWEAETLEQIRVVDGGHEGAVTDLLLTDDGKTLYSVGRDGLIMAWNTETWNLEAVFPHIHTDWILDIVFVDDRTLATTGRNGTLILWDVNRQQPIGRPLVSASSDWGIAIVIDDQTLNAYSFHNDGQIIMWEFSLEDWLTYGCAVVNIDAIPMTIQNLIDDAHSCIDT